MTTDITCKSSDINLNFRYQFKVVESSYYSIIFEDSYIICYFQININKYMYATFNSNVYDDIICYIRYCNSNL